MGIKAKAKELEIKAKARAKDLELVDSKRCTALGTVRHLEP